MKQGTSPKVVQERLGHSSISVTLDIYSHVVPGMQELAALQFDAVIPDLTPIPY
jgi:integrase